MTKKDNSNYEITADGSLGLLALGARGIIEWRKVRDAHKSENNSGKQKNNEGTTRKK